jgi:monomeric isocitrate dehydrogenase
MKITKEKITDLILEEIKAELKESSFDFVQMYKSIRQLKRVLKEMQDSGQELPALQAEDIAREAKDIQRIVMELAGGMAGAPDSIR